MTELKPEHWHQELLIIANELYEAGDLESNASSNFLQWEQVAESGQTLQISRAVIRMGKLGCEVVASARFSVDDDGIETSLMVDSAWRKKKWPKEDDFSLLIVESFRKYALIPRMAGRS